MVEILYGNGRDVLMRSLTWGLAAGLIVAGVVFWSPQVRSLPGRVAVVIGNASYSIYLGSALVLEFGGRALQRLHRIDASSALLWVGLYQVLLVVMVVATGWIGYQFVEWPLVRNLQTRYAERNKGRVPATGSVQRLRTES